jgi:Cu+-exporting ATPase
MLTGDSASEAVRVSAQLPVLSSRTLPYEKGDFIAAIQASPTFHGVAMVGDRLNDAPALAAADVCILLAPAGASALSSHTYGGGVADVVLTTAELGRLVEAVIIARQTVTQVRWNRAWAIAYNVLAVGVAAGIEGPWGLHVDARGAGLAMVGSSTSVVGWSLLFVDS